MLRIDRMKYFERILTLVQPEHGSIGGSTLVSSLVQLHVLAANHGEAPLHSQVCCSG